MKGCLVISWCGKDVDAVLRSAQRIAATGPYPDVLLYLQPELGLSAVGVHDLLSPHFFSTVVQPPFDSGPVGWPEGPNHMFKRAAKAIAEMPSVDFFYFWEPDCLPLKLGWWGLLQAEYESCGKLFMGAVLETRLQDAAGQIVYDGVHMVGSGIYPRSATQHAPNAVLPTNLAWDVAAQLQIMPLCHETKQIQHNWGTEKYTSLAQLRADAVVHHGCKDDSLYRLLTGETPSAADVVPIKSPFDPLPDAVLPDFSAILDGGDLPSTYDVVLPHAISLLQALCRDKVAKKKIQKALRDASVIETGQRSDARSKA